MIRYRGRDPRLEPPFSYAERPIRRINSRVSLEVEAVINNALQYNPGERFSSALEMKNALVAAARKTGALSKIWVRKAETSVSATPT